MKILALLQASAGSSQGIMSMGMIVLMIVIFYFFMIRPQSKQQKKIAAARAALKPGDKIMTSGGIYGTLREVNTSTNQATIEVWEGVKMKVDFNQVFSIEPTDNSKR